MTRPPAPRERPHSSGTETELAGLRERLRLSEAQTAQTLMRATRLAQVISVLGTNQDLESTVERIAIEIGELFFADMALLLLRSDAGMRVAGHWGIAAADLPTEGFTLSEVDELTREQPVRIGAATDLPLPSWLESYSPRHLVWARLVVGHRSLGLLLLARRGEEPFEASEATELRAVSYRIALAIENGLLHERMRVQLSQLHRLHDLTAVFAGMLDLNAVGQQIATTIVNETSVRSSLILLERDGERIVLSTAGEVATITEAGGPAATLDESWHQFPLTAAGETVGVLAITEPPPPGSETYELLSHLVSLGELAIAKALIYEQSREQARHDSLTGLLGHRVFHEVLEAQLAAGHPFSMLLFDIDDFKQINDLNGHQAGDRALCLVSDAIRRGTRSGDTVFRIGGEEFCAVLPGLTEDDAFATAEALRHGVASITSSLTTAVTVSVGVATFPTHGGTRDELLASADAAMYASKRGGKNRVSLAGGDTARHSAKRREISLELLNEKDPETASHSIEAAILCVEIGRALTIAGPRLDDLRTAARLHDIGKLAVPDSILSKPGPLDDDEFQIIKIHPVVGAELLTSWGQPGPAAIVRQHHEHVNGGGYPLGLRGAEILLEARIIHVADAWSAMTRDRPYRQALTRDQAVAELTRHSGSQFDGDVVAALINLERNRVSTSLVPLALLGVEADQIRSQTGERSGRTRSPVSRAQSR